MREREMRESAMREIRDKHEKRGTRTAPNPPTPPKKECRPHRHRAGAWRGGARLHLQHPRVRVTAPQVVALDEEPGRGRDDAVGLVRPALAGVRVSVPEDAHG